MYFDGGPRAERYEDDLGIFFLDAEIVVKHTDLILEGKEKGES
jgi:hypothetical protein